MRRLLLSSFLVLAGLGAASAIGVDVQELKSGARKIEFVNYTGPLSIFQTDFDIRGIGRNLAEQIDRGGFVARFLLKYTAVHAVDTAEPEKLSADIISLDKDAKVDHIDNVRRILSSYLEALYKYPRRDADLLALFTTYYNAAYRGNIGYFTGRYKSVVMSYLEPATAGISVKYFEWPGATQLVVPLSDAATRDILSALSTTELTSGAVAETLKAREDKGIPERKAIVELKQREVEQGQKKVEEAGKKLAEDKRKTQEQELALQKEKIAAEQKQAEADREAAALAAEREKAKAITDAEEKAKKEQELAARQQETERKAAEARAAEEAVKAKEAEVAAQKQEQAAREQAVTGQEQTLQTKKEEIATEQKSIAQDQTALRIQKEPEVVQKELEQKSTELAQREAEVAKREEAARKGESDAAIFAGRLYYLKIKEYLTGGHYNNEIYAINASTAKIVVKSPFTNICGRRYDIFKDGVVVITHKGDHRAGHYLTLLDLKTLEPKATGPDAVFFRSFVEIRDDMVYAILSRDDSYYLGRFGADMKTVAVSADKVDPDSFISFFGDMIYINGEDKKILVLKKEDLSTAGVVEP